MKTRLFLITLFAIVSSACQHATKNPVSDQNPELQSTTTLAIMSINDVYRINGIDNGNTGGLARVKALRNRLEDKYQHVLFLHAGDFLHPSFISKQDDGYAMIESMNRLDGVANQVDENMLVTWGNHEFDKGGMRHIPLMNDLLAKSEFTWLDSNITWKNINQSSIQSEHLAPYKLMPFGDITVGVFSFTTDIAHPEYVEAFADYQSTAQKYVPMLRELGADFVIGLTHQWLQDDLAMMALPEASRPDIIIGGHEHYVQTEQVNGNWVLKADADAASAIVAEVIFSDKGAQVFPQVIQLDAAFPQDQKLLALTQKLEQENDAQFCHNMSLNSDCLTEILGMTQQKLVAEETEIRRFETNLGNVLADTALEEFKPCDADVVLLNSGSIRLNQNIQAGANVTVKHLEEMFPYPSDLRLIEFDASILPDILAHSVSGWTANGHWLQIAGFAYIHNPDTESADHIHLNGHDELFEPAKKTHKKIRAVVPHYLISADTDHDGYDMINADMQVACEANGSEVKELFTRLLKSSPMGLNVQRDFRICNSNKDECLE